MKYVGNNRRSLTMTFRARLADANCFIRLGMSPECSVAVMHIYRNREWGDVIIGECAFRPPGGPPHASGGRGVSGRHFLRR